MKIGFMGNANNYPFMIAQAFQRMGHEIVFILDQVGELDRPENRIPEFKKDYPEWLIDLAPIHLWNPDSWLELKWKKAVDILNSCDLAVLNQYSLCLATYLNVPHMAALTGTDILVLSDLEYINKAIENYSGIVDEEEAKAFFEMQVHSQRHAVKSAFMVNSSPKELCPTQHVNLDDIGVDKRKCTIFMVADLHLHPFTERLHNDIPRVFCGTRISWDTSKGEGFTELDLKGIDVLIYGMEKYIKNHGPLDIHFVKKGPHIQETMSLIEKLDITEYFTWHDPMSQTELREEFIKSDYIVAEMGPSTLGMTTIDSLSLGRPVVANALVCSDGNLPDGFPLAVCQAQNPEEISQQLCKLENQEGYYEQKAIEGRKHVEQFFDSKLFAQSILEHYQRITEPEQFQKRPKDLSKLIDNYQPLMQEQMRKTIINLRKVEELNKKKDAFVEFYVRQKIKEHIETHADLQLFPNGQHTKWLLSLCQDLLQDIKVTVYDDTITESQTVGNICYEYSHNFQNHASVILSSDSANEKLRLVAKECFNTKLHLLYQDFPEGPYCDKSYI